jgi:hypothetical protein
MSLLLSLSFVVKKQEYIIVFDAIDVDTRILFREEEEDEENDVDDDVIRFSPVLLAVSVLVAATIASSISSNICTGSILNI